MRCVHEANLWKNNCFITLTYDDEHLPERGQLQYRDFELFLKRLRKNQTNIRFYMGGEYGTLNWRPHYHAILFNWDFADREYYKRTGSGERIDLSQTLAQLWPYGHSSVGNASFESAAYIARYCLQKRTGEEAIEWYKRYDYMGEYSLIPEFNQASRKPGIGADWIHFYKKDVYTQDYVVMNGVKTNVPKFYDKLLKRWNPELMAEFKEEREWKGYQNRADNTPERLAVKEQVAIAKTKSLLRGKI